MRNESEKHEIQTRIHVLQGYNRKMVQKIQQNREEIKWLKQLLYQECEMTRKKPTIVTITHKTWSRKA